MNFKLYSALFAAALTGFSASAQSLHVRANMPFDFRVGNTILPAGEYDLEGSMSSVRLRQVDGYACVLQRTQPVSKANTPGENRIRFTRYGDTYYLTSLWNPGTGAGEALPVGRQQRELAGRVKHVEMASISLLSSR